MGRCESTLSGAASGDGVARFLFGWLKALRWHRLPEMEKLGDTLVSHFDGSPFFCPVTIQPPRTPRL